MSTSRPLVFLGSNIALTQYVDTCRELGIEVKGIVDSDYHGNIETIDNVPVIGTEKDINFLMTLAEDCDFFCAVTWTPEDNPVMNRNRKKRHKLINLIDELDLPCANLIDPRARVSSNTKFGKGIYVDSFALIDPNVTVGDFSNIYAFTGVGHHCKIGRNCVFQRQISITGNITFEDNVFLGTACKVLKSGVTIRDNTFVNEAIYLKRGTFKDEVVSKDGHNTRRVVHVEDMVKA